MLSPCFMASSPSAIYLMELPLCAKSHFSLSAFKIFLLVFDFQHFYQDVSDCGSLYIYLILSPLSFLGV